MILNTPRKNFTLNALCLAFFLIASTTASAKHILVYGDSLSAAYGMSEDKGWVSLLAEKLTPQHRITNASISGETSGGGLARLKITLEELAPDIVFLELGANDGLRGYPTHLMESNLAAMVEAIQASDASVVLAGISLPPTYGPRYIGEFRGVYKSLAEKYELPFIDLYRPSFVETPGYIQADGLHPAEVTQPIIRDLIFEFLNEQNILED